jgi:hypothetical protein
MEVSTRQADEHRKGISMTVSKGSGNRQTQHGWLGHRRLAHISSAKVREEANVCWIGYMTVDDTSRIKIRIKSTTCLVERQLRYLWLAEELQEGTAYMAAIKAVTAAGLS